MYVYCACSKTQLHESKHSQLYKIGVTDNIKRRMQELSNSTNQPSKFYAQFCIQVYDNEAFFVEKKIHEDLSEYNYNKEFFDCDIHIIKRKFEICARKQIEYIKHEELQNVKCNTKKKSQELQESRESQKGLHKESQESQELQKGLHKESQESQELQELQKESRGSQKGSQESRGSQKGSQESRGSQKESQKGLRNSVNSEYYKHINMSHVLRIGDIIRHGDKNTTNENFWKGVSSLDDKNQMVLIHNHTNNQIIKDVIQYKSPSQFTSAHYKESRPDRTSSSGGWVEIEVLRDEEWISMFELRNHLLNIILSDEQETLKETSFEDKMHAYLSNKF